VSAEPVTMQVWRAATDKPGCPLCFWWRIGLGTVVGSATARRPLRELLGNGRVGGSAPGTGLDP